MKFTEFEIIMNSKGVNTLADIARALNSTPQAVSNWKARDQVPYHIVARINTSSTEIEIREDNFNKTAFVDIDSDKTTLSNVLLTLAEEFKIIAITAFIAIFFTFTYVKFIQEPKYVSSATILLSESKSNSMSGLAGLASQFGVSMPTSAQADLSSPSLLPELLKSRAFASKIIDRKISNENSDEEISLLEILTESDFNSYPRDILVTRAMSKLANMINFTNGSAGSFSSISVTATTPLFAKELAEVVLTELQSLNRDLKIRSVSEKITFIENRIFNVQKQLGSAEKDLKLFREKNRQISSPTLMLLEEQLDREVEVQKGIYLTLKQQLELAKIEEVQTSILQILDSPQLPLWPSNKNIRLSIILSTFFGLGLGIFLGFFRSYFKTPDINERKKLRRGKFFFKKKVKDLISDYRVYGVVGTSFILGAPFFLGHKSENPVFFNLYSFKAIAINIAYIIIIILSVSFFIKGLRKKQSI